MRFLWALKSAGQHKGTNAPSIGGQLVTFAGSGEPRRIEYVTL